MEELFTNIPEDIRKRTKFWIEVSLAQPHVYDGMKMIEDFRASCNEEEKEYIDFVFASYMERLR